MMTLVKKKKYKSKTFNRTSSSLLLSILKLLVLLICVNKCIATQLTMKKDVKFAILDGLFVNENFDTEIEKSLEVTNNIVDSPAYTVAVKFPLAVLTCMDGAEKFAGALLPIIFDTMKEQYENKGSLARVIAENDHREMVRIGIIEKNLDIKTILFSFKKIKKYPGGMCSLLETAHKSLNAIVVEFASEELYYRKFPSATSQVLLTIAPIASMIAQHVPYLEWQTDMNCKISRYIR